MGKALNQNGLQTIGDWEGFYQMSISQHKLVNALPDVLEKDSIYYVRRGEGYDQYITNKSGTIVAYKDNSAIMQTGLGGNEDSPMSQNALTIEFAKKAELVSTNNMFGGIKTKLVGTTLHISTEEDL